MKKLLAIIPAIALMAMGITPVFAGDSEFGGEIRVRYERENMNRVALGLAHPDWDEDAVDSEDYWNLRALLNAKVRAGDRTTAFISLHAVDKWGETSVVGAPADTKTDNSDVGLNQGYLNIVNAIGPIDLKVGRQTLSYGSQRLLGASEWADTSNRWDALKLTHKTEAVDIDLFIAKLEYKDSSSTKDHDLNGLYATFKQVVPGSTLDVYAIQKDTDTGADFMTYGVRVAGKGDTIDWDAEMAKQSGDYNASMDQDAGAWAINAGYALSDSIRIGAQKWSASGGVSGSDVETFDNLYPTNHFKYGITDVAATDWSDREGTGFDVTWKAADGVKIKAEYVSVETEDSGIDVGTEFNLQLFYNLTEKTELYAYYANFSPDDEWLGAGMQDDAYELIGVQIHAKF